MNWSETDPEADSEDGDEDDAVPLKNMTSESDEGMTMTPA